MALLLRSTVDLLMQSARAIAPRGGQSERQVVVLAADKKRKIFFRAFGRPAESLRLFSGEQFSGSICTSQPGGNCACTHSCEERAAAWRSDRRDWAALGEIARPSTPPRRSQAPLRWGLAWRSPPTQRPGNPGRRRDCRLESLISVSFPLFTPPPPPGTIEAWQSSGLPFRVAVAR